MLTIRVRNQEGQQRLYQFREKEIHIGFRRGADIELEPYDRHGSSLKLSELSPDKYRVEPVMRSRGFFVNGEEVRKPVTCSVGDSITTEDYAVLLEETHPDSYGEETRALRAEEQADPLEAVAVDKSDNFLKLFFGPIAEHLDDPAVTEIMINGPDRIYIEKKGHLTKIDAKFINEQALEAAVKNVARSVGRVFNDKDPRLDARLPDGSRVHAVIPPMARFGTTVAIRKFSAEKLTVPQLIGFGSLTDEGFRLIDTIVKLHKNVIVSGATSSGKTSILNVLSSFIQPEERIIIIEDSSELQLQQDHLVPFETRKPDEKGKGEVSIRDLIHSSLRLRPDRIIIGEIRGGEALDLLQALNTGHGGSMSTIHSNSPLDSLSRMETCALLSGVDMPLHALRSQVANAIEVVVQTARLMDGSRKIISIAEVMPLEDGMYMTQDLIKFYSKGLGDDGKLRGYHGGCGVEPSFAEDARLAKFDYDPAWFKKPES